MSTWYDEDVGSHNRPTPWDGAIENDCPTCREPAGSKCVFEGRVKHMPCVKRLKLVSA